MSEITRLPDGTFALVERDNQLGTDTRIKKVYGVDLAGADFRPYGGPLATVGKTLLADLIDELEANSVWTPDKLEGVGVTADGEVYLVNDGLDEAIGQTVFLHLGDVEDAFGLQRAEAPLGTTPPKLASAVIAAAEILIARLVQRWLSTPVTHPA